MMCLLARLMFVVSLLGILQPVHAALYVSDQLNGAVFIGADSGGNLTRFIAPGSGGLQGAVGLMLHPTSNLLMVASQGSGDVKLYNSTTGAYVGNFATGLASPSGITLGQHNDILVTGFFGNNQIYRFDYNGNPLPSVNQGTLSSVSTAIFGPDNKLYATSYDNGLVLRYAWNATAQNYLLDTSQNPNGIFAQQDGPTQPNNLTNPAGLAFDQSGKLYVTDLENHTILTYNPDGTFAGIFASGPPSAFPAQISFYGDKVITAETNIGRGLGSYDLAGNYLGRYARYPGVLPDDPPVYINGAFLFTTAIPEPGTWAMLACCGLGAAWYRRRYRSV